MIKLAFLLVVKSWFTKKKKIYMYVSIYVYILETTGYPCVKTNTSLSHSVCQNISQVLQKFKYKVVELWT